MTVRVTIFTVRWRVSRELGRFPRWSHFAVQCTVAANGKWFFHCNRIEGHTPCSYREHPLLLSKEPSDWPKNTGQCRKMGELPHPSLSLSARLGSMPRRSDKPTHVQQTRDFSRAMTQVSIFPSKWVVRVTSTKISPIQCKVRQSLPERLLGVFEQTLKKKERRKQYTIAILSTTRGMIDPSWLNNGTPS